MGRPTDLHLFRAHADRLAGDSPKLRFNSFVWGYWTIEQLKPPMNIPIPYLRVATSIESSFCLTKPSFNTIFLLRQKSLFPADIVRVLSGGNVRPPLTMHFILYRSYPGFTPTRTCVSLLDPPRISSLHFDLSGKTCYFFLYSMVRFIASP